MPRDSSEEPSAKVVAPSGLWVKAEMVTQPCSPPKRQKQVDFSFKKKLKAKNLKQLRKVPAMDIVKNTAFESFWPNVDGYSITDDQYKLYERKLQ